MTPTETPPPPPTGVSATTPSPSGDFGAVPPPPDRLVRRTGDRVVAGVAAGLGRHYGIDPVLVRVMFVITTFAAGLGALAYLVLWIVMPKVEGPAPSDTMVAERGPGFWVGAVVVTIGGAIALSNLPAPRLFIPLALIAVGAALWQRPSSGASPSGAPSASPPSADHVARATTSGGGASAVATTSLDPAADVAAIPTTAAATSVSTTSPPGSPPSGQGSPAPGGPDGDPPAEPTQQIRWWVPPAPRPQPSWLGPVVIAVALLVTGVVAALGAADVLAVRGSDLVAVALLVLAGGMVVGTFWGRAKWLSMPAAALAGLLVALQLLGAYGVQFTPRIGEQHVTATNLDGTLTAQHGIGEVEVDLADAEIGDGANVDLDLGIGHAIVIVPDDVTVEVAGQVGIGAVHWSVASGTDPETGDVVVSRQTLADGRDLELDAVLPSAAPDAGVLRVDVAAGIGVVDIYRGREALDAQRGAGAFDGDDLPDNFPGGSGGFAPGEASSLKRVQEWFVTDLCLGSPADEMDLQDCWTAVTFDPDVVDDLADEGGFFADFCLDQDLVRDDPELVDDCLAALRDAGARLRTPEEGN